eukprot:scaffold8505_cov130-Cylindrotheca_fusiformis.AAC.22
MTGSLKTQPRKLKSVVFAALTMGSKAIESSSHQRSAAAGVDVDLTVIAGCLSAIRMSALETFCRAVSVTLYFVQKASILRHGHKETTLPSLSQSLSDYSDSDTLNLNSANSTLRREDNRTSTNATALETSDLSGSTRKATPLNGLDSSSSDNVLTKRTYRYMTPNLGGNFASLSMDYFKDSTKGSIPRMGYRYTSPTSSSASNNMTLPPYLQASIQPNDTITLYELQEILKHNGYVRQEDLSSVQKNTYSTNLFKNTNNRGNEEVVVESTMTQRKIGGVALPQLSVLSYKSLQRGTLVASAIYGMVLSCTILPNLWLVGAILGGMYGYEVASLKEGNLPPAPKNVASKLCISSGRRLAKVSLRLFDGLRALWFLYKTGQLSYEYYKRYEVMDKRFGIQDKMDAFNARYQEKKKAFDRWEKENEISRTILAGLRTVWLVDEQAKLRAKKKSRYRVIQWVYSVKYYIQRQWEKLSSFMSNNRSKAWSEFWTGVGQDVKNSGRDAMGTRIGAVVASLVVINIAGALFVISPPLLTVLAALMGVVWPSWVPELAERIKLLAEETRARGRGDDSNTLAGANSSNRARLLGRYDKSKYHYYKRPDGSRHYYRTGQSFFRFQNLDKGPQQKKTRSWPWNRGHDDSKRPWDDWWNFGGQN